MREELFRTYDIDALKRIFKNDNTLQRILDNEAQINFAIVEVEEISRIIGIYAEYGNIQNICMDFDLNDAFVSNKMNSFVNEVIRLVGFFSQKEQISKAAYKLINDFCNAKGYDFHKLFG